MQEKAQWQAYLVEYGFTAGDGVDHTQCLGTTSFTKSLLESPEDAKVIMRDFRYRIFF